MGDWGDQRAVELTDELMDHLARRARAIAQQMAFYELDYDELPFECARPWVNVRVSSRYL